MGDLGRCLVVSSSWSCGFVAGHADVLPAAAAAAATSAAEPSALAVLVAGRRAQDLRDHGADADYDLRSDGHEIPRDYLGRSCTGTRASDWEVHAVR